VPEQRLDDAVDTVGGAGPVARRRAADATDQCDLPPRLAVPTLLMWRRRDGRSPLRIARQFDDAIPDSEPS
jgi:hypothetical protein